MQYMFTCHKENRIHRHCVFGQGELRFIRQFYPYDLLFRKILPIADAILSLKPLVIGLFPGFYLLATDNMCFACLFQSLNTKRK